MRQILQETSALFHKHGGNRSTTLKPIGWMISLLLIALIVSFNNLEESWLHVLLGISLGSLIALYILAYIYFMFKNPDLLRSESFNIHKMSIEKGVIGDSEVGIIKDKKSISLSIDATDLDTSK